MAEPIRPEFSVSTHMTQRRMVKFEQSYNNAEHYENWPLEKQQSKIMVNLKDQTQSKEI